MDLFGFFRARRQAPAAPLRSGVRAAPPGRPARQNDDLRARAAEVAGALRMSLQARRGSYRAASNPRSRVQNPLGGTGDQHVDVWSRRLARELSRDLDRNADTFRILMDAFVAAVAGDGVRYRPTTSDTEWNLKASEAIHRKMCRQIGGVDAREMRTGYQLLRDYIRAAAVDGEAGMILRNDGRAVAFESEQVTNGGATTENDVDGVRMDDDGRVVSYKIAPFDSIGTIALREGEDYPAEHVMFTAIRSRFSQTRGMPTLVNALDDWERIDSYRESEIIAAEQSAGIYGAIEYPEGNQGTGSPFAGSSENPGTGLGGGFRDPNNTVDWQPTTHGAIIETPNGSKYVPVDPKRPNREAAPFLIEMLRQFCGNLALPYEFVYNDLRGLSWSVNRALVQIARDRTSIWQTTIFAPAISQFYAWLVQHMIATGELDAHDEWESHELAWPQMSWPDEGKEYEAQALGLEKGLTTRQRVHGPAWRAILAERAEEAAVCAQLAADHNAKFPDSQVDMWFFLGFNPEKPAGAIDGADEVKTKPAKKKTGSDE